MTLTLACVPISSTPSPPWPMTTKSLHTSGMMWSSTANSMPWRTSECVLLLPSHPFVHRSDELSCTVLCGISFVSFSLPYDILTGTATWKHCCQWVGGTLAPQGKNLLFTSKIINDVGMSHSTRFSIFLLGFLPWWPLLPTARLSSTL